MTGLRAPRPPSPTAATAPSSPQPLRRLGRLTASLAAFAVLAAPAAQAVTSGPADTSGEDRAAARTVTIRPEALSRGVEVRGPHLASPTSHTIVDGDTRVTVPGDFVSLLGSYQSSYVVYVVRGDEVSVRRVGPGGSERIVAEYVDGGVTMSSGDGSPTLATTRSTSSGRSTTIEVVAVRDGRPVRSRTFATYMEVLDLQGDTHQAIIGSNAGTYLWDLPSNTTTLLTRRTNGIADFDANRLSTLAGDPYDGGCTVVTTLTQPQTALWTSCSERVEAFSPDGQRMATIDILSDGQGPTRVQTRSVRGTLLASYRADGYFGAIRWESTKVLLLDTFGRDKNATVRCTGSSCDRASALRANPEL